MLWIVAGVIGAIVAIVLVLAAMKPAEFRVERSLEMHALPASVHRFVNDFAQWTHWSPWEGIDPNMRRTYSGAAAGVGAHYAWASDNQKAGEGKMTITESSPEKIAFTIEFIKPIKATNQASFTFRGEGTKTSVTWTMDGRNNLAGKVFALLMNMDKLVGGDFEKGLAKLRALAEAETKP